MVATTDPAGLSQVAGHPSLGHAQDGGSPDPTLHVNVADPTDPAGGPSALRRAPDRACARLAFPAVRLRALRRPRVVTR